MNRLPDCQKPVATWFLWYAMVLALGCTGDSFPKEIPSDPAKYLAALNRYPLTSTAHKRKRKQDCQSCNDSIEVTIQARGNTLAIDPANPPAVAVPVAHLFHDSARKKDAYYQMRSRGEAEYDLWVYYSSDQKKGVWTLVEMEHPGSKPKAIRTDDFDYCVKD